MFCRWAQSDFFFFFFFFFFCLYVYIFIFINTMKGTINSTEVWNNSHMCLAMSHHPYMFGSLLLKLRSHGQCFFGNEYIRILSKVCAFTGQRLCQIKFANDSLPKSFWQIIFSSVYTRMTETHHILPEQIHLSVYIVIFVANQTNLLVGT